MLRSVALLVLAAVALGAGGSVWAADLEVPPTPMGVELPLHLDAEEAEEGDEIVPSSRGLDGLAPAVATDANAGAADRAHDAPPTRPPRA